MINVSASVDATVEPRVLYDVVSDLGTYPGWLDIVGRAVPTEPAPASPPGGPPAGRSTGPPDGDGPNAAWLVDLRAQLGPLRRSKRLRMERTVARVAEVARFERRELDDRSHSDWVLTATIEPTGGGSRLTMDLHYGGSLWLPALDRVLQQEIRRSSRRLMAMVDSSEDRDDG